MTLIEMACHEERELALFGLYDKTILSFEISLLEDIRVSIFYELKSVIKI